MEIQDAVRLPEADQAGRAVINVPIGSIITNPFQPRRFFDAGALRELANSIKEYGILQPLLVVPLEGEQYLLIAGERRLRAAYMAEIETVPVLLGNYSSQEVAEIAMIENLQREDLHFLDEASGYGLLMREFGITQEMLAKRVGKNQSTIANKLRILKLGKAVLEGLRSAALTERHARALLKLPEESQQLSVLQAAADNELNVRQTEELVEQLLGYSLEPPETVPEKPSGKRTRIIRDVRIFINSVKKVVDDIKKIGINVKLDKKETDKELILTMKIPLSAQIRNAPRPADEQKEVPAPVDFAPAAGWDDEPSV
ncbi:MAG: ParB/RepB/Spo0J family partition protein [Acidaminococcales bacterium]|jgi:ParB family chromosome partitioning protein|nr:ParB/RepB/Spo0J family partition protein [Acidaminococcales bacterium]